MELNPDVQLRRYLCCEIMSLNSQQGPECLAPTSLSKVEILTSVMLILIVYLTGPGITWETSLLGTPVMHYLD